ncbi:hypothetical protein [Actinoplanes solisilvae]|uniref:hypothetical protein n=1 Tax=Actinoplanes solisilvae TaxID=2486853 RepID=UPI000FDB533D|nr:hypothetical protein [Actinoplanes solisilvae]
MLAPAVWGLAGAGLTRDLTARGRDDFAVESVTGLLLLVLAGAAYAILLLAPISAAGPLAGGLAFLGISVWVLVSPAGYASIWPESVAKEGFDLSRPGYGLALLLALPLICVALSPRRWARPSVRRDSSDPTEEMRLPLIMPASDDTTTVLTARPPDDPTEVLSSDEPTVAVPAAEATLAVPTHRDERRTVIVVSWDEVAAVAALGEGEASTEVARPAITAPADPDHTRPITLARPDDADVTRPITVVAAGDSDATRPIAVAGSDEAEVTRPLTVPAAATMRLLPPPTPAPLAGHPGEATAVIGRPVDEDETQVIGLDPERTQIIRPGSVEGPGERTEIVRLPVKDRAAIPAQRGPNREQPPESDIPA